MTLTRYCADDHDPVWTTGAPCWFCGGWGVPATGPYAPARSWRNPASPEDEDTEITG